MTRAGTWAWQFPVWRGRRCHARSSDSTIFAELVKTGAKKRPKPLAEVPGVENTDWAPLLPCEGVFGQTQSKRWVMDRSGGFSGLSCHSDPDLTSRPRENVTQGQGSRACGRQAAIPVGLLIGLPKSGPQSRTRQSLQTVCRTISTIRISHNQRKH